MAASMEADIRARFWVALVLSAFVVAISPMGEMLGLHLPLSDAVRSWTLLGITTLATPTVVAVGTGVGARHNILIKDAATLEGAARITAVAFDNAVMLRRSGAHLLLTESTA